MKGGEDLLVHADQCADQLRRIIEKDSGSCATWSRVCVAGEGGTAVADAPSLAGLEPRMVRAVDGGALSLRLPMEAEGMWRMDWLLDVGHMHKGFDRMGIEVLSQVMRRFQRAMHRCVNVAYVWESGDQGDWAGKGGGALPPTALTCLAEV